MKTFCPSCEKETNCVYIAELYECKECGCDFESKQRQMQERLDAANARAEAAEARVPELQAALDAAINMNIEKNAKVTRLTAALREANEDGLDIATLEYAAKWIENSLAGETSDRVIEFGKSMAMSIRAAKPLVKICAECGGSGEVAGDYFSDDGMSTCARCNGVGHERI